MMHAATGPEADEVVAHRNIKKPELSPLIRISLKHS
jgi:hypothetical protein